MANNTQFSSRYGLATRQCCYHVTADA